eukprot:CAMPEP_0194524482 /NCGR_PEP_ID=MMETSP0253-20130528/59664_1 /TAXON_ID=2966 /ORGANISM="Noctiluca scintillans" /LENGTH=65 /DNA_ID=CAMNT_0039369109 /DNA_START=1 /DNA_END=195 /DNA_ORIENTATION=+
MARAKAAEKKGAKPAGRNATPKQGNAKPSKDGKVQLGIMGFFASPGVGAAVESPLHPSPLRKVGS